MFTGKLLMDNPRLLECGFELLSNGEIQPDTYVLDVDSILENAQQIKNAAAECGIELYYMTKQFGRNPYIAKKLEVIGYRGAVAVDWREALTLAAGGARLGHAGHLVQIPQGVLPELLSLRPEVLTVYSMDMARAVNRIAGEIGVKQKLLLKTYECGDVVYPGQEGGIPFSLLTTVAEQIEKLKNVSVEGLTSFPCFLYNQALEKIKATPNMTTLRAAADVLVKNGVAINQLNTPSATCVASLPLIREQGGTHGEPGHALTGTTPLHAVTSQPEKPAIVYMSEVSHNHGAGSLCYGGGYYRRGNMKSAILKTADGWRLTASGAVSNDAIDYYLPLNERLDVGSAVAFCFRTQVFVTRSHVALVEGIASGTPKLAGMYDAQGKRLDAGK